MTLLILPYTLLQSNSELQLFRKIGCKRQYPSNNFKKNIIGKWTYGFPYYYSELNIQRNGIFSFYEGGCTSKGYTKGQWKIEGQYLVLNSYPKYKIEKKSTYSVWVDSSKINYDSSSHSFPTNVVVSPMGIYINRPDTINIYFHNQLFKYQNDTLFQTTKNKFIEKTNFIRN